MGRVMGLEVVTASYTLASLLMRSRFLLRYIEVVVVNILLGQKMMIISLYKL